MRITTSTILLALALVAPACDKGETTTTPPPETPKTEAPPPVVVSPIPAGFFTLTPSITVKGADAAVDFYVKAFGAQKLFALPGPDGKTMHAEIKIGDSIVMIDEEMPEGGKSPTTLGGSPATLMVYTPDADAMFAAAVAAGATAKMPVEEQFWGDRYGELTDPFGHSWAVATHVEDLTDEQMGQRAAIMMASMDPKAKKKKKKPKKGAPPEWKTIVGTPATAGQPKNYHTVTASIVLHDANAAIEFYKSVFGATEKGRMAMPDGKLMHAELAFGDAVIMLSDEMPGMSKSAKTLGGSPVALMMYTPDVDGVFAKATGAGATPAMPVTDMFWGDRFGMVIGPDGYGWAIATHKEDLTPEQIAERMKTQAPPKPAA
jgi:PhnB protein